MTAAATPGRRPRSIGRALLRRDALDLARDFLESFEGVFDYDWDMTRESIRSDYAIRPGCTFINPGVEDEHSNWWNRGGLLYRYRSLRHAFEMLDAEGDQ